MYFFCILIFIFFISKRYFSNSQRQKERLRNQKHVLFKLFSLSSYFFYILLPTHLFFLTVSIPVTELHNRKENWLNSSTSIFVCFNDNILVNLSRSSSYLDDYRLSENNQQSLKSVLYVLKVSGKIVYGWINKIH